MPDFASKIMPTLAAGLAVPVSNAPLFGIATKPALTKKHLFSDKKVVKTVFSDRSKCWIVRTGHWSQQHRWRSRNPTAAMEPGTVNLMIYRSFLMTMMVKRVHRVTSVVAAIPQHGRRAGTTTAQQRLPCCSSNSSCSCSHRPALDLARAAVAAAAVLSVATAVTMGHAQAQQATAALRHRKLCSSSSRAPDWAAAAGATTTGARWVVVVMPSPRLLLCRHCSRCRCCVVSLLG